MKIQTLPRALAQAIAQLEGHREALGDAAVDAAIQALRQHVAPSPAVLPAPHTEPRLRQVSVLFADVADSTAMLGRVDTEDAQDLLGRALQLLSDAVQRWGGQVLRFTGDGVKAAFGTQGLREDEAERAVRAGLQILADATRHAERVQRELGVSGFGVRVGIHTGAVLLGGGVEAERTAMGHAVHLAARMEQSAPVGRLRISDATWAQVRGLFRAEPQPPLRVKGHDEPLRSWLVLAAETGAEPSVLRGVEGVTTPMIGRDAELAQLLALHTDCTRARQLTPALVLAEAGVGKTRLRQELLRALALAEGDGGLLQARAQPSSQVQPYGLLRQLLARWLSIADDLDSHAACQRLVQGLSPWLGEKAAQNAPRIGQLVGLDFGAHVAVQGLGPQALRSAAFEALRQALLAKAAIQPLLVVLDDLHWADDASLEFVQALLEPAPVPLMLLLLARPALHERSTVPRVPSAAGGAVLTLSPLNTTQGNALVDVLLQPLPNAPATLRQLLVERAAGNPFYLEALLRMLIDDGVIDARARPWVLHADRLAGLRVPPTLVGVLQARLDALPSSELLALQQASIVGPTFWGDALQALDTGATAALPALSRRALVSPHATSAFANTEEHTFAHQLLHETTYGTVLKEHKREGHARAARWLAARVSDRAGEFLAITAEHYERAGDSAQALEFWDRARSDAMGRFASRAALHFTERALAQAALTDASWRFQLMSMRCLLLDRIGLAEEAAAARVSLGAWAESQDDDAMRADVLQHEMLLADHAGRPHEAQAHAQRILELAARAPGTVAESAAALAHGELAWLALQRDDHDETARQVEAGIVRARAAALVPSRQGGYIGYERQLRAIAINALLDQERPAAALEAVHQARAALDAQATPYDHWSLLQRECQALRLMGRLDEAAVCADQMLERALQIGVARLLPPAHDGRAWLALWQARLDRLASELLEFEPVALATDGGYMLPEVRELQARLAAATGDHTLAGQLWHEAAESYAAQGRAKAAQTPRARLARLDLQAGRTDAAAHAVDALLAEAAAHALRDRRSLVPEVLLDCHHVLAALGDPRAAALKSDLRLRLEEQLAAINDPAGRQCLVDHVPHWREAAQLLGLTVGSSAR